MQRRSTARTTPRKQYTVDAFENIPELKDAAAETDDIEVIDLGDDPEDEHQPARRQTTKPAKVVEVSAINEARRRWANDLILPSRREDADGLGGFHCSFSQSHDAREDNSRDDNPPDGWTWYDKNGGEKVLRARQRLEVLNAEEATSYLGTQEQRSFVMGPYTDQKMFHLHAGQGMALSDAWDVPADASEPRSEQGASLDPRPGFLLNLGAKARCLEWVPGHDGSAQFLTISVSSQHEVAQQSSNNDSSAADLQSPTHPTVAIWRFQADDEGYVDTTVTPAPKLVLCTAWGAIRTFRWCPILHQNARTLGLLAVVSEDGVLRVLQVPLPSADGGVSYIRVSQIALECKPDDSLCACVAWLSPTRIATGSANGFAHVWDLTECISSSTDSKPNLSILMSSTYIASMTTCGLSHPQMLLTSSADGTLRMADLSQPSPIGSSFTATVQLNIVSQPLILWHDYSQRALTSDDNCDILARPLRKRLTKVAVGKARSSVTAVAGSPCHPCVLIGTAGGEVLVTNPLLKSTSPKVDFWQQLWFTHEWRRPTGEETAAVDTPQPVTDDHNEASPPVGKEGLSRILDGFKAGRVAPDTKGKVIATFGSSACNIYEADTAVTALAWNQNIKYGGWAAAGMANGLLRVEDIAV